MSERVLLANTWESVARAVRHGDSKWTVDYMLADRGVRCLAADPCSPATVYAGTDGQGVLRSDDRGKTWRQAGLEGQVVRSLAASPHQAGTLYAGVRPAGFYISRDSGATWQESAGFQRIPNRWWWFSPAGKPFTAYVQAIAISPTDPDVILAGIEFGAVVRSADGGQTWSAHRSGALRDCHNLKFHAQDGDWAYEAGGTGGGASYSRDGGKTWRKAKAGLAKHYGVSCAADPARPEVWYVCVAPGPGKAHGDQPEVYLYRSNGGAEWEPIGWSSHPLGGAPTALVTDPGAPGHLYAGLTNGTVFHSIDYGETWDLLPLQLPGIWFSMLVLSADAHKGRERDG